MNDRIFGGVFPLLEKALDIRSERHQVITANIANQDTPHFKAKEIDFTQALQAATGTTGALPLDTTNPSHLQTAFTPSSGSAGVSTAPPAQHGMVRLDGNTVNAEKEMARLAENTVMYQATVHFISRQFAKLKNAMQ